MTLRILWTYEHPTARFQEMMLFPAAGMEVVPTFTDSPTAWLDNRYHDESHPLYPRWRNFCSLPVNTVERVRRSRLWERDFNLEGADAQLINAHFDAIFINCSPETLKNIFKWFRGKILFRCNGGPNRKALYEDAAAWVDAAKQCGRLKDFIYLPGHLNLVVPEMPANGVQIIHFPVFAEESRIPGEWAGKTSSTIATAISYLDFHAHFKSQLTEIARAYGDSKLNVRVFGKNKTARSPARNIEIVGGLPSDNEFWGQIFACSAFVDAGADPTHTVFPPLEAAIKGMPVFFHRDNGHAHAIRDALPDAVVDETIGVFNSHDDIKDYLERHCDDLDALTTINRKQTRVLRSYFSRHNALKACAEIADALTPFYRRLLPSKRARLQDPVPFETTPLAKLLDPSRARSTADFGLLNVRSGKPIPHSGYAVWEARSGPAEELPVLSEYLPELAPGDYEISINYETSGEFDGAVGHFEFGWWENAVDYKSETVVYLPSAPRAAIKFAVTEEDRHWRREIRLSVHSLATVKYASVELRAAQPSGQESPAPQ